MPPNQRRHPLSWKRLQHDGGPGVVPLFLLLNGKLAPSVPEKANLLFPPSPFSLPSYLLHPSNFSFLFLLLKRNIQFFYLSLSFLFFFYLAPKIYFFLFYFSSLLFSFLFFGLLFLFKPRIGCKPSLRIESRTGTTSHPRPVSLSTGSPGSTSSS